MLQILIETPDGNVVNVRYQGVVILVLYGGILAALEYDVTGYHVKQ